jgi:hypothetical protein
MTFYGNILASTYKFYGRFKGETPYFSSIIYIAWCQTELAFFGMFLLKKHFAIDLLYWLPNKYWGLPFAFLGLILIYRYYSKERVKILIDKFDKKSTWERIIWGIISLISLLGPLAYFLTR